MGATLKYFLIIAFAIFAVTGLIVGYLASYFLLRIVAYLSPWLPTWMWYADIGLFVHAVSLAATSTLGILGVLANKSHALKLCTWILVSLLLIYIVVTVQLCTRTAFLDDALQSDMKDFMHLSQTYYSFNISDTQMWDEIQLEVNCCGVKSYEDWFSTQYGNGTSVPDSCCLLVTVGCGANIASKSEPDDEIITKGCLPTLMTSIRQDFNHYGYSLWLPVLGVQTVLVLFIIYVVRQNKKAPSYWPSIPTLLEDTPKYKPLQEPAYKVHN